MSHERRIFVQEDLSVGSSVKIPSEDSHHLKKVVRLKEGDQIVIVERQTGKEFLATLGSWQNEDLKIISEYAKQRSPSVITGILPALCKGGTNEVIVEKATELGVERILFWIGERSVVRLDTKEEREHKRERFERIAEEASKQAARNSIPQIEIFASLKEALEMLPLENSIYWGSLSPKAKGISTLLRPQKGAYIVIGPEGDFVSSEEEELSSRAVPFSLGTNRLKAETAALASIAAFNEVFR